MSKGMVAILQNSLAENEQIRKRQLAAFGVLFLAMSSVLLWIGRLAGQASTDSRTMVVWAVIASGYLLPCARTGAVYQPHGGQTT
jgi:hypothetical protein